MADKWQSIDQFWNGFGIPAYDETSVPDDAVMPYITYSVSVGGIDDPVFISGSLWYKSTSWSDVSRKCNEISDYLDARWPLTAEIDSGRVYITKGSPFAQRMTDPDDRIRRVYINLTVEFLTT